MYAVSTDVARDIYYLNEMRKIHGKIIIASHSTEAEQIDSNSMSQYLTRTFYCFVCFAENIASHTEDKDKRKK